MSTAAPRVAVVTGASRGIGEAIELEGLEGHCAGRAIVEWDVGGHGEGSIIVCTILSRWA